MAHLLQHAFALAFLAAVLVLPGLTLETRLALGVRPDLRPLARIVLGLGFWIVCLFLLAACGLLRPWILWTVAATVIFQAGAAWLASGRRIAWPSRPSPSAIPVVLLLAAVLAPLGLLAMTPTVSWDASAYHLTLPRLYLDHGGFREVPFNVYSYWPLGVELLFALALAIDDFVLAKLLHFAFGVATLYALAAGGRAFHRPASGALAALLFLANGVVAFELRVAYVDLAHAFLLLAGLLFMLEARSREPRALWLSGLCCGLAAGVKLTGIAGAAMIGALWLPRLAGGGALRSFLVRFAAPVLALWLLWVLRTTTLAGNPAYPFLHGWLGGPDWSPRLTEQLRAWQSSIGMGREPIDYLLLPLRVALAGGAGYERFDGEIAAFWVVFVPLALWIAFRSRGTGAVLARRCLAVAGLYFVYWSLSSQQMRLLIPALPMLALAGAAAWVEVAERLSARLWRRAAVAAALVAVAASMIAGEGRALAAGYRTLGVYLRSEGDLVAGAGHPIWGFVNTRLPPEARVLLLNTNQGFFCRREFLADSFFEASQITDWLAPATDAAAVRALLDDRGVNHVLVERRFRGAVYPEALLGLLRDPAQAQPIHRSEDGRFSIFALR